MADRRVVITGAASGIGRALAKRCVAAGAGVALLDRDTGGLEEARSELAEAGARVHTEACDVGDAGAVERAITASAAALGGLDVLVNNAGIAHRSLFAETASSVHDAVMRVDFEGAVHCTRAALPWIREARGSIVAVSSIAGFAPLIGRTAYAAAKHALVGFFESLRAELRPDGVHVLLVYPWYTATPIDHRALAGDGRPVSTHKPVVGRRLTPDEVASAMLRALGRRRERLVLTARGKLAFYLSRLCPRLYEAMMRRVVAAEFEPAPREPETCRNPGS